MRIGYGYDVHRFSEDRKLILGGVTIPFLQGLLGHSDADVLIHAICDALLGAAALGDIGKHFPDNDNTYKNIDSGILLKQVCEILYNNGYEISNIDSTIIAQAPKLAPYIDQMSSNLARICKVDCSQVKVKATTEEHLGFTGHMEGIAAHAVCLINK